MSTSTTLTTLSADELHAALGLRDLSDPSQGRHAMQLLLDAVVSAAHRRLGGTRRTVRSTPLVAVRDNYDLLGYRSGDVTRDARHTRYVSRTTMLRSHTSAELPATLADYAIRTDPVAELVVVPGLVHRRDVVDRTHVGSPHQVDLWQIRSDPDAGEDALLDLVDAVVGAVLPGARWRTTPASHPYTRGGRQVDVWHDPHGTGGEWLELAECGLVAPEVLSRAGLDPAQWSGLALGMGLDRALMLCKGIPDIRYLRSDEPRIRGQLADLAPWRPVSVLPPITRDLSVVVDGDTADETIGDQVRTALADRVDDIEEVVTLSRTSWADLPERARQRLGMEPGQENLLVRVVLRPLQRTLTDAEANALRDRVLRAIHRGPTLDLIGQEA